MNVALAFLVGSVFILVTSLFTAREFDLFLHISEHTKSDFLKALPGANKQHVVTHLAVDSSFQPPLFPVTRA